MRLAENVQESFLHYIWQTLNFDTQNLFAMTGEEIHIYRPGELNYDQGPDFLQAHIRIGELDWWGQVEIHVKTLDWFKHGHHKDPRYNATVLHVVGESNGRDVEREDGTIIPELELGNLISPDLQKKYESLQLAQTRIPCERLLRKVPQPQIEKWLDRVAEERLIQRANQMKERLQASHSDWEQVLWEELAAMIAGPANQEAFREMAQRLPMQVIRHYSAHPQKIEALMFGAMGSLSGEKGDYYYQKLRDEWKFLQEKHQLEAGHPLALKFLRMRPLAFPTIRISQLAHIIHQFNPLSQLLDAQFFNSFLKSSIPTAGYWEVHYQFLQAAPRKKKFLGKDQKMVLIINTLIPLSILYAEAHGRIELDPQALEGMKLLPAENNRVTRLYQQLKFPLTHALHSQGMIQLYKHYCSSRKCLSCGIGRQILRQK